MGAALFYAGRKDYHYHKEHEEERPHFLQSCTLCSKHIGFNSDIFMYRGNSPYCSKECRQEQIDMDEANERRRKRMLKSINDKIPPSSSDKIVAVSS